MSIIMPVYNAEKWLSVAINSALGQSYSNLELLVINDGSSDSSREIVQSFKDPRIIYFENKENQGVSATRNVGMRNMNGDFFCFLDADDFLPENSIKSRIEILLNNPEADFADGTVLRMDESLEKTESVYKPNFKGNPLKELILIKDSCFFGLSWMIRRKKDQQYAFDTEMTHGEDLWFYITIANRGLYLYTDEVVLKYRQGAEHAMSNLDGLSKGYHQLFSRIVSLSILSLKQRIFLYLKIKKIMGLSYLANHQVIKAFIYLLKPGLS
mgnify:CR=1 FL=1